MNIKRIFGLLFYKLFSRVDKNIFYFSSFDGKYCDSPKCLSKTIHEMDPNKKIYWLLNDVNNNDIPNYVNRIKKGSLKEYKYQYKAGVIIDNVYANKESVLCSTKLISRIIYSFKKWLKRKKGQKIYTTWHGTIAKRMGRDQIGNNIIDWTCDNTTMILGNKHSMDIMNHLTFEKIKMQLLGTPRNDILLDYSINTNVLKEKLGLPINKKVLLFAPTFKTDPNTNEVDVFRSGINQINLIDFDLLADALNKKFGGDWIFVCRFHYHVEKRVDWEALNKKYNGKIFNGNLYEDIADYLKCTDVLLTDLSSCIFDFSLLYKPAFILFPDKEYYENQERGLYMDMSKFPYPIATDYTELQNNINEFDITSYLLKLDDFNKKFDYVNLDKNSSEIIAKYILDDSK